MNPVRIIVMAPPQPSLESRAYTLALTGEEPMGAALTELKALAKSPTERQQVCEHWRLGRIAALEAEGAPKNCPRVAAVLGMRFK